MFPKVAQCPAKSLSSRHDGEKEFRIPFVASVGVAPAEKSRILSLGLSETANEDGIIPTVVQCSHLTRA